jgi:hypothetical protein
MVGTKRIALLGLGLTLAGCAAPQTPSQLSDRLSNAEQITDSKQKDDALQQIAKDAANAGNGQVCVYAVAEISNSNLKDGTAHTCADVFNGRGDRTTAEVLVNKISDTGLQNEIRKAYASQPAPQPH